MRFKKIISELVERKKKELKGLAKKKKKKKLVVFSRQDLSNIIEKEHQYNKENCLSANMQESILY